MLALIPCTFTIYITIIYHLQKNKCASLGPFCLLLLHGYGGLVILFFMSLQTLLQKVETNKLNKTPLQQINKGCKPLFSRLEI